MLPAGMKGSYDTVQAKIEKVYTADHNGFHFQAYVVKWQDQEVVVTNLPGQGTEKKVGDTLTFMVQEMEMPMMGKTVKMIQFMAMDGDAFKAMGDALKKAEESKKKDDAEKSTPAPKDAAQ